MVEEVLGGHIEVNPGLAYISITGRQRIHEKMRPRTLMTDDQHGGPRFGEEREFFRNCHNLLSCVRIGQIQGIRAFY
jgi:hypothetical protein